MKKILIVEDDSRLALALAIRLKAHGYATWNAIDAVSAVGMAIRIKPDLILLDICLPGGDGFKVIKRFDDLPETREVPIIITTASKDPELRNKALDLGATGLLRKPYESDELLAVVEHALDWQENQESHFAPVEEPPSFLPVHRSRKVLIIEDDERVAMALSIRLGAAGLETVVAHDALSAVRSALSIKPDVIVLDISLPAGDGFSVAERIQTHLPLPTRIIFLTASKRPDFRARAEQLGAVGFFEKPYEPNALLSAVQEALG